MKSALRWASLAVLAASAAQAEPVICTVTDAGGGAVARAVVVAVPNIPPATAVPADATMDQVDKTFVPGELVVQVGTRVHFPNSDHVRHQVYSFSPAKNFEIPLYAGTEAEPVLFDKPGPVTLGCNIHDWMRGYIYVADSPWYAQTNAEGVAALDLPPGDYVLHVWHPQMRDAEDTTRQALAVAPGEKQDMRWKLALKPVFSPRRAPMGDAGGGY